MVKASDVIKLILEEQQLSQNDIATLTGYSQSTISKYVNDKEQPSFEKLNNICTKCEYTLLHALMVLENS